MTLSLNASRLPSQLGLLAAAGQRRVAGRRLLLPVRRWACAPCELCYWQRWPHMVAIAAGLPALAAFAWPRLALVLVLTAITALLVTAGDRRLPCRRRVSLVGRDRRPARATCRAASRAEQLKKYLFGAKMVRCDETAWAMWGISMAGWNAHPLGARLAFVLASGVARWVRSRP